MGDYLEITLRLLIALAFGGMVGLERSYHGRPAGFRTHVLVCLGSALLMLVTVYEGQWFVPHGAGRVTVDPTRMAQGIMTGIGFLGAGVIMKEGLSVRGLRVYQVLFTGYWFWGNLLSPKAFPTISDTALNAVGQYPLQAYFEMFTDSTHNVTTGFTKPEAVLNLIVLMACIAIALFATDRYLRWQARRV